MKVIQKFKLIAILMFLSIICYAQKGAGNRTGMAQQRINPEVIKFTGKILEFKDGPCEYTHGRSISGTHLIIEVIDNSLINVHLGPTDEVSHIVGELEIGQEIEVFVFRTSDLAVNHFIAKEIKTGKREFVLRDSILRPFWAGKRK